MKYKLINFDTQEEHLCDKVTIDGFEYYVNGEKINSSNYEDFNFWFYNPYIKELQINCNPNSCHKVIATNNPNIDVPKIIDEVQELAFDYYEQIKRNYYSTGQNVQLPKSNKEFQAMGDGFIEGYNKSQETHSYSEEDMIEFAEWCEIHQWNFNAITKTWWNILNANLFLTTKELFNIWKEQRVKTIYFK